MTGITVVNVVFIFAPFSHPWVFQIHPGPWAVSPGPDQGDGYACGHTKSPCHHCSLLRNWTPTRTFTRQTQTPGRTMDPKKDPTRTMSTVVPVRPRSEQGERRKRKHWTCVTYRWAGGGGGGGGTKQLVSQSDPKVNKCRLEWKDSW